MSNAESAKGQSAGVGGGVVAAAKDTYSYANLCKDHFRPTNVLPQFSRKEPRSPLLRTTSDEELDLIVRVWRMILRFMTDASENRHNAKTSAKSRSQKRLNSSIMPRLRQEISALNRQGVQRSDLEGAESGVGQGAASGGTSPEATGSKRLKISLKKKLSLVVSTDRKDEVVSLEDTVQTGFDQMQFIIGIGILRPELMDEIYSQILRQLTNNTLKTGKTRLFELLNLMIGVYPPSDMMLPYVAKFVDEGASVHCTAALRKLLVRVRQNGPRFQPPSKVEYLAILNKQPIDLQVTLMDGTSHSISSDACTTSAEIVRSVAEEIELEEMFGFSLFIAMENKISSLGCTDDKVFDSISQCEQVYYPTPSRSGSQAAEAPWRLFIRKEMFSPWDDITGNPVSTNLVYSQIVRGIMLGEYVCEQDSDLAAVAAMQYYVEYECDFTEDNLYSALPYYVPSNKLTGEDSIRIWCKQVAKFLRKMITAYAKSDDNYGRSPDDVKAELVAWAKRKWPKAFSRYFDVRRLEGPRWNCDSLILGVNSKGISLTTANGDMGLDATYPQIASVMGESHDPGLKLISGTVIIFVFADGTLIKIDSADANDIYRLITSNMAGLTERSTWAVAKQECHDMASGYVSCIEGDLIQLKNPAKDEALTSETCECINMATDEEGRLQTTMLHILPCVDQPKDDILRLFRSPNYYTKRATEILRQQSLEASIQVHGEEEEEEAMVDVENEDLRKLDIIVEEDGGKQKAEEKRDEKENYLILGTSDDDRSISSDHDEEASDANGEDSAREAEERQEPTDKDPINDDLELASIGFDRDFFSALNLFQRDGLETNDEQQQQQTSSDKEYSSFV